MANVLLDLIHSTDQRQAIGWRAHEFVETHRSVEQLPGLLEDVYAYFFDRPHGSLIIDG